MNLEIGEKEFSYMQKFQALVKVLPTSVVEEGDALFFLVPSRELGKAIGRKGGNIRKLEKAFGKRVLVFADSNSPERFARNFFNNVRIVSLELREAMDDKAIFMVIDERDKGVAIGKNGARIKAARKFLEKKFGAKLFLKTKRLP